MMFIVKNGIQTTLIGFQMASEILGRWNVRTKISQICKSVSLWGWNVWLKGFMANPHINPSILHSTGIWVNQSGRQSKYNISGAGNSYIRRHALARRVTGGRPCDQLFTEHSTISCLQTRTLFVTGYSCQLTDLSLASVTLLSDGSLLLRCVSVNMLFVVLESNM